MGAEKSRCSRDKGPLHLQYFSLFRGVEWGAWVKLSPHVPEKPVF
jgi:hypothetical protein